MTVTKCTPWIAATIFAAASSASWAQSDPRNDGLAFGKGQLSNSARKVNDASAKDLPYYNANPPQTKNFGAPSLFQVGAQRITDCSNYVPTGDKIKDQECSAVNFLAKNPQNRVRITVNSNDPAVLAGRAAMNGATESLADPGACVQTMTTAPAEYAIETCSEYLTASDKQCVVGRVVEASGNSRFQCDITYKATESINCTRGYGATIQNASQPKSVGLAAGTEIPTNSIKTYSAQIQIDGSPGVFTLNTYQADNYGQLWVNGTKVWENRLASQVWPDMRNGYIGQIYVSQTCTYSSESGESYDCSYYQPHLYSSAGVDYGTFWDDGCNAGCKGQAPNLDISSYMKNGVNVVEMVCLNQESIGPCKYNISGTDNVPTVVGTYVDNQCSILEARSQ